MASDKCTYLPITEMKMIELCDELEEKIKESQKMYIYASSFTRIS